ncbi:MAG: ATP-grasp domain-containing protein, partial [Planctomycetes bacterium]|nr:ATP-grasp domain-containing protein [Planctomycetota bacterium]
MPRKLLIANRGEVAVRIARACRDAGVRSVAVYSEADRGALHVRLADEAEPIGPAPAAASYLRSTALLEAARRHGCDAVHPGYGFLSENAGFAAACRDAGLSFVGPPPEAIAAMGDKPRARHLMAAAGVPVVPGAELDPSDSGAVRSALESVGLPLMVKAAGGGGGKGIRLVREASELPSALERASSEAARAFGDPRVYLERYIEGARHVEVQVLADSRGHVVHLHERECSVQRRHQKLIEEAPCPSISAATREALYRAAVAAARAAGYVNAGTVEFL